ncbi:PBSX family phage terminase large subunit [Caulobacter sp. 17J80-11]|uniref:PBSX family phage terminase large subunit n=1 Tax=Caulobacter sp. 17J80-11 TaxID=2763502 RepID=UPI001653720F|nr:phage terminase large subunit [Caulobacter sp. 17J80-11]MBC6982468.1 PBSX family phage terminase large subunit [Caulobacter sp. 17J80-11]
MTSTLRFERPSVFRPLVGPARYKGAWGGRGSGKSHFFAELLIQRCLEGPTRALCVREVQVSLAQSVKRLIEDKIAAHGVAGTFEVRRDRIGTPGGGLIVFQGMQDHTAESVKSFEGFDIAWVEEAQTLSERSLTLLRPTLRKPGSELWFSWNPRRRTDPVDRLLRGEVPPPGAAVVRALWSDNPWFPAELEAERQFDQERAPERYAHVWEGDYLAVTEGAYFAAQLNDARKTGRVGAVAADPLVRVRAFWDLGVSDATAIWVAQFVGREIRVLDYGEGQGQPLAYYVDWLRRRGWGEALCVLPHDGAERDAVSAVRFEDHLRQAGFEVTTVRNQGRGAAMQRIEAARRLFARIWFDAEKTEAGVEALGAYHERRDEARRVGLGPAHDWASHAADAFGLMCVAYEEPQVRLRPEGRAGVRRPGGWMG